ncbi:hypothetical protein MRX96_054229 [Rhipicephalus microplus]
MTYGKRDVEQVAIAQAAVGPASSRLHARREAIARPPELARARPLWAAISLSLIRILIMERERWRDEIRFIRGSTRRRRRTPRAFGSGARIWSPSVVHVLPARQPLLVAGACVGTSVGMHELAA